MSINEVNIPKYSLAEELLNAISHGLGAVFGIVALVLMLLKTCPGGDPKKQIYQILNIITCNQRMQSSLNILNVIA